jgi:hypothetical protein
MSLSRQEQNKAFRNNLIYGTQLAQKWKVDPHELSYIILKQNLSVLDIPRWEYQFKKHNPNYYKTDSEKLLKIILYERIKLRDKAFWLPEIQRVTDYVSSLPKKNRKTPNWPFDPPPPPLVRYSKVSQEVSKPPKEEREDEKKSHPKQTKKNLQVYLRMLLNSMRAT